MYLNALCSLMIVNDIMMWFIFKWIIKMDRKQQYNLSQLDHCFPFYNIFCLLHLFDIFTLAYYGINDIQLFSIQYLAIYIVFVANFFSHSSYSYLFVFFSFLIDTNCEQWILFIFYLKTSDEIHSKAPEVFK